MMLLGVADILSSFLEVYPDSDAAAFTFLVAVLHFLPNLAMLFDFYHVVRDG